MSRRYIMGNGAIGLGALAAGVKLAAGYPGTPSSEVIETIAKERPEGVHVEWSVNEKAAMEVAAAAAYSGARAIVTMKQVGLNVAADPIMSLAYVGVKGGMVVVSADDPGPISSQTEQDTRAFADFCRIPVFDPSSPEEAYEMIQDAFDLSEKYRTPVLFRPTTRVCHGYASIDAADTYRPREYDGFVKDPSRWVIFPRLSFANHKMIESRNVEIGRELSSYRYNTVTGGSSEKAVFASGVSYAYAMEFLRDHPDVRVVKISTPHPFPEELALRALDGIKEVLCVEELSPYVEDQLCRAVGSHELGVKILGKRTGHTPTAGENTADDVASAIAKFIGVERERSGIDVSDAPELPARPPVLCAGCSHRASFYAVKSEMKGERAYFCGDIGCYTLGNAMPLDMVDTCLCMGAGITMAQGFHWVDESAKSFAFVGDSTFFASGMTGVVNALYNGADMTLCVLDNSTTAMTGHQPHPGTGRDLMGRDVRAVDIVKVLDGMGVRTIKVVDPLKLDDAISTVKEVASMSGVKAIIFKSPCVALEKPSGSARINENCVACRRCIDEIGCPAIVIDGGKIAIDGALCTGCGTCAYVCKVGAIECKGGGA